MNAYNAYASASYRNMPAEKMCDEIKSHLDEMGYVHNEANFLATLDWMYEGIKQNEHFTKFIEVARGLNNIPVNLWEIHPPLSTLEEYWNGDETYLTDRLGCIYDCSQRKRPSFFGFTGIFADDNVIFFRALIEENPDKDWLKDADIIDKIFEFTITHKAIGILNYIYELQEIPDSLKIMFFHRLYILPQDSLCSFLGKLRKIYFGMAIETRDGSKHVPYIVRELMQESVQKLIMKAKRRDYMFHLSLMGYLQTVEKGLFNQFIKSYYADSPHDDDVIAYVENAAIAPRSNETDVRALSA